MKPLTGGELLVENLADQGVKHVFSIIGGQMGTIYDAISRRSEIEMISPRCETASALMACGYTASTGIPSASMATVGAGVIYEVAGLTKAWFNYLPVISIAPQVQSWKVKPHQESLQACNQDEIFYPVTKWNTIVYHWDRIPQTVHRAFREATENIPGPVHIDVPVDILFKHKVLTKRKKRRIMPDPAKSRYIGPIKGDVNALKEASDTISQAQRPVIIIGQGIGRPGRYPDIRETLNNMGIPVITTIASSGIMCGRDKCYAGDITLYAGSEHGFGVLKEADLLLIVGIDPYSRKVISLVKDSPQLKTIIQLEVDPSAFINITTSPIDVHADAQRGLAFIGDAIKVGEKLPVPLLDRFIKQVRTAVQPDADSSALTKTTIDLIGVHADPQRGLAFIEGSMEDEEEEKSYSSWLGKFIEAGDVTARTLSKELKDVENIFPILGKVSTDNDIIIVDGKDACLGAVCLLREAVYRNLFIMDGRDIPGAGLPFAIGAAIGNPDCRITLICDDNSLLYHVRELQPAVSMGLDFNIICIDRADGVTNVADTASILEGLGCDVCKFDPEKTREEDLLKHRAGVPGAVIFTPSMGDE